MKLDILLFGGRGSKSNSKSVGSIGGGESDAIFDYTTSKYVDINNNLRNGGNGGENSDIVKNIDSAINKSTIKSGTTLYRGTSTEALGLNKSVRDLSADDIKSLVGKNIADKAYVSTSLKKNVADNFAGRSNNVDGKVNMIITTKGNKRGLEVGSNSNFGNKEKEIILPRGASLKVTKAQKRTGQLYVYLEY